MGKVLNAWKLSFVVIIPKCSRTHKPNNYRPTSLLCILSKLLEKHIHSLMVAHLEEFHPLFDCHFRAGCSTYCDCFAVNYSRVAAASGVWQGHSWNISGISKGFRQCAGCTSDQQAGRRWSACQPVSMQTNVYQLAARMRCVSCC